MPRLNLKTQNKFHNIFYNSAKYLSPVILFSLVFGLVHVLIVGPFVIPAFEAAGLGSLRAPIIEEAYKWIILVYFLAKPFGLFRGILIVTASLALAETIINLFVVYEDMIADLGDMPDLELVVGAGLVLKFLLTWIGQIFTISICYALLKRKQYYLGFSISVLTHWFLNVFVLG